MYYSGTYRTNATFQNFKGIRENRKGVYKVKLCWWTVNNPSRSRKSYTISVMTLDQTWRNSIKSEKNLLTAALFSIVLASSSSSFCLQRWWFKISSCRALALFSWESCLLVSSRSSSTYRNTIKLLASSEKSELAISSHSPWYPGKYFCFSSHDNPSINNKFLFSSEKKWRNTECLIVI